MKSLNTNELINAEVSNDAFSRSVGKIKETAEIIERKSYTLLAGGAPALQRLP